MSIQLKLIGRRPLEFSDLEIQDFMALVVAGGEVAIQGLENRIRSAAWLVYLFMGPMLSGVAALKRPEAGYRNGIARKARVPLPMATFPYELGYVFVTPRMRGRGLSCDLVLEVLVAARGAGVFATTRSNNGAMQATLSKCGFAPQGKPYRSVLGGGKLQLFTRVATRRDISKSIHRDD